MIKTIIFDLFGVICSEVAPFWFEKYFPKKEATLLKNKYFHPLDLGEISEKELYTKLGKLVDKAPQEVARELDKFKIINSEIVQNIKKLRQNYKLILFSNGGSNFVRSILKSYQLENLFDSIIISAEHGLAKPDVKIYQIILKELATNPQESLFIDDNPINIAAAKKMGFKTIKFVNNKQFVKELSNFI